VVLPSLSSTAEAGVAAQSYFRVRMLSIPVLLLSVAVREVRYGLGDSQTPMRAALVANATNIGLDYLLIFGLDWGVTGAAAATVIAHCVEAAVLFWAQARAGLDVGGTRPVHLRVLWRLGVPTGLQYLLEVGSFAVLASMLAKLSDMDMAAHMIALQVVHFSFLPAAAIGEGASVMVGEAVGAGREALVRRVARLAMVVAGIYTAACGLVFWLGGPWLAGGFTDDPDLLALTVHLLLVAAIFQIFDAANIVGRSVLRGVGDVRVPAVICIVIAWVVTPPATWWLGYHLGYGALGAWIGLCGEIMAGAVLLWWRLERGTWREAARQTAGERDRARAAVAVASA